MSEIELKTESKSFSENPVIHYLKDRYEKKDRATLATLRNGLREKDCRSMEMYQFLGKFLSDSTSQNYEDAVFIVSALFASYSQAKNVKGNLGDSLREYQRKTESESVEKRFVSLLNAERDELSTYLRNIINLLKSQEIGVNWEKLFNDIQQWNTDNRFVQTRLARSFWGNINTENTEKGE